MPTAHPYVRVSKDEQATDGNSLPTQKARLADLYAAHLARTHTLAAFYEDDGVSATKVPFDRRPAGGRLMLLARRGDAVLVNHLDRAFRSIEDQARTMRVWRESGVRLFTPGEGEIDLHRADVRMFVNLLGVVQEHQSDRSGERIRQGMAQAKAEGRVYSNTVPLGFQAVVEQGVGDGRRAKKYMLPEPHERLVMYQVLRWRESGVTLAGIRHHMMKYGIKVRSDTIWKEANWNHDINDIITKERHLEALEAAIPDLTQDFVTPHGAVLSFDFFRHWMPKKKLDAARYWRNLLTPTEEPQCPAADDLDGGPSGGTDETGTTTDG